MKKTKILSFVVVLATMISLVIALGISASADAATPPIGNVTYSYTSGDFTLKVTGSGEALAVWHTNDYYYINGKKEWVSGLNFSSTGRANNIKNIVIEEGITAIGDSAFIDTGITSITIPASVTTIGANAFKNCTSLQTVTFAAGSKLTSIGDNAFASCRSLSSIQLPSGLTSMGESVFFDCQAITSIEIPSGVTSVGQFIFSQCYSLRSVKFKGNITSIGAAPFNFCNNLESVTFGEESTFNIPDSFLSGRTNLTSVTIPGACTSIGSGAFSGTGITSITIPAGVTSIGKSAFENCASLQTVTIADGSKLESIGEQAFQNCANLTSINLPSCLKTVEQRAFNECTSLTGITIPSGVTSIGRAAFSKVPLTTLAVGACHIATEAFSCCPNLTTVYFMGKVDFAGTDVWAFAGCESLLDIWFLDKSSLLMASGQVFQASVGDQYKRTHAATVHWVGTSSDSSGIAGYVTNYGDSAQDYLTIKYISSDVGGTPISVRALRDGTATPIVPGKTVTHIDAMGGGYSDGKDGTNIKLPTNAVYTLLITTSDNSTYFAKVNLNFVDTYIKNDSTYLQTLKYQSEGMYELKLNMKFGKVIPHVADEILDTDAVFSTSEKAWNTFVSAYEDALNITPSSTQIDVDDAYRTLLIAYRNFVTTLRVNLVSYNGDGGYTFSTDKNDGAFLGGNLEISGDKIENPTGVTTLTATATIGDITFSWDQAYGEKPQPQSDDPGTTGGGTTEDDGYDYNYGITRLFGSFYKVTGNFESVTVDGNQISGGVFVALEQRTYTIVLHWENGETKTIKHTPEAVSAMLTYNDGTGMISLNIPSEITVNNLYYTGESDLTDGKNYLTLTPATREVVALGSTVHTFRIVYTYNGLTDVISPSIDLTEVIDPKPVAVCYGSAVGIFYYGANVGDIEWAAYANGDFNDAATVQGRSDVVYACVDGSIVSKSEFTTGTYTFCFKTKDGDKIAKCTIGN